MSFAKDWILLPDADLAISKNWRTIGNNQYAAFRARILIIKTKGQKSQFGPVISAHNVAPNDTITLKVRREKIISNTETINKAIQFTVTSKVCDQLAAKVSSELSIKALGYAGKVQSELYNNREYEITEEIERVLHQTTSHSIQETEEKEHVIRLNGGITKREAVLRRRFWPRVWDVYLHSFEYLELIYRRHWLWWQIRQTIKQTHSGVLGWPLVSLIFYEPQSEFDVCYDPVKEEIQDPEIVEVTPLSNQMPVSRPPKVEALEDLAKLAFPVTKDEKREAVVYIEHIKRLEKVKTTAAKKKTAAARKKTSVAKKKTAVTGKKAVATAKKKAVAARKKTTVAKKKAVATKKKA